MPLIRGGVPIPLLEAKNELMGSVEYHLNSFKQFLHQVHIPTIAQVPFTILGNVAASP
jgi:hypothetical protein